VFLQRVEWALEGFRIERSEIPAAFAEVARPFQMHWSLRSRTSSRASPFFASARAPLPHRPARALEHPRAQGADPVGDQQSRRAPRDRGAFRRAVPPPSDRRRRPGSPGGTRARAARGRACRPGRARALHAGPFGRVRRRVSRARHQHPPLVSARVRGSEALPSGAGARGEDHRRDRALRDRRAGSGSDHRAGRGPRESTATPSRT
jgi:hypothetical protein